MPDPVNTFLIEEDIPNGLRVELRETDMPFGRPREMTGFESGGELIIAEGGIYNPGSDRVVLQVMQPKERPLIIKGAFRDRIYPNVQRTNVGDALPVHARTMRDSCDLIRRRGNPVKLTWANETRIGLLIDAKFGEESANDITYELKFFIAVGPTQVNVSTVSLTKPAASLADLQAQMKANLAKIQAAHLALAMTAAMQAAFANLFSGLSSALDNLGFACVLLEKNTAGTAQSAVTNANRVISSAASVQSAASSLKSALDQTRADAAMLTNSVDSFNAYWASQYNAEVVMDQILDAMRQIRFQTLQSLRASTRIYKVQANDTLEAIAQSQLGSKARANDLGIRADQLQPGSYIRIPQAS